jgi:hypothetical protein
MKNVGAKVETNRLKNKQPVSCVQYCTCLKFTSGAMNLSSMNLVHFGNREPSKYGTRWAQLPKGLEIGAWERFALNGRLDIMFTTRELLFVRFQSDATGYMR